MGEAEISPCTDQNFSCPNPSSLTTIATLIFSIQIKFWRRMGEAEISPCTDQNFSCPNPSELNILAILIFT